MCVACVIFGRVSDAQQSSHFLRFEHSDHGSLPVCRSLFFTLATRPKITQATQATRPTAATKAAPRDTKSHQTSPHLTGPHRGHQRFLKKFPRFFSSVFCALRHKSTHSERTAKQLHHRPRRCAECDRTSAHVSLRRTEEVETTAEQTRTVDWSRDADT